MAYELAAAYVSVIAQTKGVGKQIQRDFGQQADAAGVSAGKTSGKKFGGAFLGVAKKAGAIGAAIAVGMAAKGGISRALNIEEAQAKLTGLGHSTKSVTTIMDNAMASVKGTAFGLGDAATVAAGVVAAGVKPGKDLERTLKLVGDGATIAGVGMSEMGAIFGKVATSNKVQGDVINQLNDAGIPIVQLLGKEMGKTGEEVMAMSKKGEIGFNVFQAAMEKGLGGAALKSGETFRGSMANTGAAMSRIGETVMSPFLNIMKSGMNALIPILDGVNSALKPVMASFGAWADQNLPKVIAGISAGFAAVGATVTPVFAQIAAVAGPVFSQIGATIGPLIPQIVAFATSFSPLSLILQAITPLLPQIVAMFGTLGTTIAGLVAQILPLAQSLMAAIVPAFMSLVQGVLPLVITLVTTLVTAVAPLIAQLVSGLAPIITQLATSIFPMVVTALTAIIAAIMPVVNIIIATLMPVIQALIPVVTSVFQGIATIIQAAMQIVLGVIQVVTGILTGNWSQVWEGVKNILSGVWNLIVGVVTTAINLVLGVITAIGAVIVGLWEGTWTGIKQTFEGVWNAITSFVSSAIANVAGFISGGIATVTGIWSAGWAAIGAFLSAAWAAIKSAVSTGISNVLSFFQQLPGQIGGFLSGLPDRLLSVGTDMINGLINGISNMGGAVMDAIGGVVDGAVNFAKGLLGIKSPSRVFRDQIGKMVSRGLAAGITADSKKAVDAVKKLSAQVAKAGEDGIKKEAKRLQAARRKANEKIRAYNKAQAKMKSSSRKDLLSTLSADDAEKQAKKNLSRQIAGQKKAQAIVNAQAKKTAKLWAKGAGKGTDKLLAKLTKNGNWRAGTSKTVKGSTLTDIARAREVVAGRLEKANDKLASMLDMRNDIRDAIKGELDLRAGIGEDTTNDYGYTVKGKTTFASVAGTVKALAAKAKKFAGKLKALVKKGIPSGLVQEIAGYGTDEGIKVADALLSGSGAQVKELAADYSSLTHWSTEAGRHVTEQFFGIGINAQKGMIKGLEADDAKLVKAAKKLTDKITKAVKKALGIKSPSRVFRDQIGAHLPTGIIAGMDRGQAALDARVSGLVNPALATAQPAVKSVGGAGAGGRSLSDADIDAMAAAFAAQLDALPAPQLMVDRRQAGTLVRAGLNAEGRLK